MESLDAISASDLDNSIGFEGALWPSSNVSRGPNESIGLIRSSNDIVVLLLQMSLANLLVPMKYETNKSIILTEAT